MADTALRTGEPMPPERVAAGDESGPWARRAAALERFVLVAGLAGAAVALQGAWADGQRAPVVVAGLRISGEAAGGVRADGLRAVAHRAAERVRTRPMTLVAGRSSVQATPEDLGARVDLDGAVDAALEVGRSGSILDDLRDRVQAARGWVDVQLGFTFDESVALARLQSLAPEVETPSLPTRLDFVGRKVVPAERGVALLAYDSLSAVATGLAAGADTIELTVAQKLPVDDPLSAVASDLDIGAVLGSFDTPYQTDASHKDRTHNLKVGSTAVDGFVLSPQQVFSFNAVVGPRTAENGYRYGTGIAGGQLVDMLGGGICQVSSTLFGAGFFAGLEIVSARPHSRPSSYVDMGLDSTVVYPTIDLKLRNPYPFAVVLHMTVRQGKVHAEVLGPRRPYQVSFERTLQETVPFGTVWRDDDRLRSGSETLAQRGRRGFKLQRTRTFVQAGEAVRTEAWELNYPPTTQIVRRGTNPSGEVPPQTQLPPLRDPAPVLKITQ